MFNSEKVYSFDDIANQYAGECVTLTDMVKEYAYKDDADDEYNSMISCALAEETKKLHQLHSDILLVHPDAIKNEVLPCLQDQSKWVRNFAGITTKVDEIIKRNDGMFTKNELKLAMNTMMEIANYIPTITVAFSNHPQLLIAYPEEEYKEYVQFLQRMGRRLYKTYMFMSWWIK